MSEDWLGRWAQGNIGWHQAGGNPWLREWWPELIPGTRVLVPLCGKSVDLMWLAGQGLEVTGVEISTIAVRDFFREQQLGFQVERSAGGDLYRADDRPVTIFCGDYFAFTAPCFDALFDRAALVALPAARRPDYVAHTRALLRAGASQLLISLTYDQSRVQGPPFSVPADEVRRYWPGLRAVAEYNDIDNGPPKFRAAGLEQLMETVWTGTA